MIEQIKVTFKDKNGKKYSNFFNTNEGIKKYIKQNSSLIIVKKEKVNLIEVLPSWSMLYKQFEDDIMNGSKEAKEVTCREIKKLCRIADMYNKVVK